ncbi:MAG TPA: isoprenylcysteine carboxylmethyltransferase family protein [Candidatus Eremiobacteraceae bacterium]|nr:isoprenylcysteine carboxylmethyltransferase family protein [Candidatus Eremiobacteraceae bacterium]
MPAEQTTRSWKDLVFKNRGLLLVPIALVLIVFGRPSLESAIIGIVVAAAGEMLRIWAVGYSGVTTRANVVTAPQLVTAGPYSRMRNPLYVGNAIIALGFWTAFSGRVPLWVAAAMLLCVIVLIGGVYGVIVPLEERYLEQQFGGEYRRYRGQVPRIVPASKPLMQQQQRGRWRSDVIVRAESITLSYFLLMVVLVCLKLGRLSGS